MSVLMGLRSFFDVEENDPSSDTCRLQQAEELRRVELAVEAVIALQAEMNLKSKKEKARDQMRKHRMTAPAAKSVPRAAPPELSR